MLAVFAEVFAALMLVLGLFSRVAAFILVVDLAVAVFMYHKGQLKPAETAIVFLCGFLFILFAGPGRFSVDAMAGK